VRRQAAVLPYRQGRTPWLGFVRRTYHVIGTSPDKYHTTPQEFEAQLKMIKGTGIHVATVMEAIKELAPPH
jgi:hypothetical protein